MEKFGIPHHCSEDFSKMTPTERGAFCNKCSIDTYSFYSKSIPEIKSILKANIGNEICGRFAPGQIEAINAEFEAWSFQSKKSFQSAFAMTLLVVFGLSLFSCNDKTNEFEILNFQQTTKEIVTGLENDAYLKDAAKDLSFTSEKIQFIFPQTYYPFSCDFGNYIGWNMMPAGQVYLPEYYSNWLNHPIQMPENTIIPVDTVAVAEEDSIEEVIPVSSNEFVALVFPNPTTSHSTVEFKNLEKARYKIDLYDINGKHFQDLFSGKIDEEVFRQEIDLSDLPNGTYLIVLTSRKLKETLRIIKN